DVDRKAVPTGSNGDIRFPDLAKKIEDEWTANGSHRAGSDKKFDLAILHTDNTTPFSDVIAVIDAIYSPKRDFDFAGKSEKVPSFNVTFAVN
ncbi:MAG TPA: biopolymer transporter, partial [Polyangiaceae bacterium]|nr:biopolymer transporter [Polyangiaceae bacterium]